MNGIVNKPVSESIDMSTGEIAELTFSVNMDLGAFSLDNRSFLIPNDYDNKIIILSVKSAEVFGKTGYNFVNNRSPKIGPMIMCDNYDYSVHAGIVITSYVGTSSEDYGNLTLELTAICFVCKGRLQPSYAQTRILYIPQEYPITLKS